MTSATPYETRPTLVLRAKRLVPAPFVEAMILSLLALVISLALFGAFVSLSGRNPIRVYEVMFKGSFQTQYAWSNSLIHAAPILLTALCVALPARVGMVVIGGEGCVLLGGLMAALVAHALPNVPWPFAPILMCLVGMLVGGLWISIVGVLRQYRGVNETISSLLMNYIALAILNHCVEGPMRDPSAVEHPSSFPVGPNYSIGSFLLKFHWRIPALNLDIWAHHFDDIHYGLIFGLVFCVACWILMDHTTVGFATRIVGGNVRAAKIAGLSVARFSLIACFLGGAAASLAGVVEVAATQHTANDALAAGYGYTGILCAFVARQNPLAVIPVAILLGGLNASGGLLQMNKDVRLSSASVQVFEGILFLVILGLDTWSGRLKDAPRILIVKPIQKLIRLVAKPSTAGVVHAGA